jgi:hypothetical protein
MRVDTEWVKVLSQQAEILKRLAIAAKREHLELSMRERALQRMVSQADARLLALFPASSDQPTCPLLESDPSVVEQCVLDEIVAPSTWMKQLEINAGVNAAAAEVAGAQQMDVYGLTAEHIAYVGRASVLVIRMNTPLARPGDLAELEALTRTHFATIVKTGITSIRTVWTCHALNFETGQVEHPPAEMSQHVLAKVGLSQEQLLTLSAGAVIYCLVMSISVACFLCRGCGCKPTVLL